MKYIIIIFTTTIFAFSSCAQNDYIEVPRTKISIKKLENAKPLTSQPGFINDDYSIIFIESAEANYFKEVSKIDAHSYKLRGLNILSDNELIIDNYNAKLFHLESGDETINSIILYWGDSTFFVSAICNYNNSRPDLYKKLKRNLQSIKYDNNKVINPFDGVDFTVDTVSSKFRLMLFSMNMYMFALDSNMTDNALITISTADKDNSITKEEILKMSIDRLSYNGVYGYINDTTEDFKIKNSDAIYSKGDAYKGTKRMQLNLLIISMKDYFIIANGLCDYESKTTKKEIDSFLKNIGVKN